MSFNVIVKIFGIIPKYYALFIFLDSDERIDQSHYNWFRARLMFMAITSMIPYVFWHGFGGKPFEKLWRMLCTLI